MPTGTCTICGRKVRIHAKGQCRRCYNRLREQAGRKPRIYRHVLVGACEYCGKPVYTPRRQYCSTACGRLANRQAHADRANTYVEQLERYFDRKSRTCLVCGCEFQSEGPWNRQCLKCLARAPKGGKEVKYGEPK